MLLIDQTDAGDGARLESEQQLAGAAWAIASSGAHDLEPLAEFVRSAV